MKTWWCVALGALLLTCSSASTSAEEPEPFATSLTRSDLLLYFARADRADTVQGWLDVMYAPLADLPDWERRRFQQECELRLADWLTRRWGEQLPDADLEGLLRAVEAADRTLLFAEHPAEGSQRDDRGGLLLRGTEGLEEDRAAWREQVRQSMSSLVERWEHQAAVVWQELLAELPAELQERLAGGAKTSLACYTQQVRSEFARLCRQAESRFVAARLREALPLRAQSEARGAAQIALALIQSTRSGLEETRSVLVDSGLSGASGASVLPLALEGDDWDSRFRTELQRGLESWNLAEGRLLEERLRWEAAARGTLLESEQAWERAFDELAGARREWIGEMQAAYEGGRARWEQAQDSLFAEYLLRTEQLAEGSRRELNRLQEQVQATAAVYRSSAQLSDLAEQSIRVIQQEIQRIQGLSPGRQEELAGSVADLQQELTYWQGEDGRGGVLGQSLNACAQARQEMLGLEAAVRGLGAGRLAAELDGYTSLEQELERLEAELAYLRRQADIARAVLSYAEAAAGQQEGSAGGIGARFTEAACAEARRELELRHGAYLEAAGMLQEFIEGESWDPAAYSALQAELDTAARACREARYRLQQAEEILGYAGTPYALPELDPEAVLARRQEDCRRTEEVIEALRALRCGSPLPFPARMDGDYAELRQSEAECLEALQHLELGRGQLLLALQLLEDEVGAAGQELARQVAQVFAFRRQAGEGECEVLAFDLDEALMKAGQLGALTEFAVGDEQALAAQVQAYFGGEAQGVARRLSTDAVVWLLALNRSDQGAASTLKRLGLAYFHDVTLEGDLELAGGPEISAAILANGSFCTLVGEDFLNLGPRTLQVWNEQTRAWEQIVVYPPAKLTPEDYLAQVASSAYQEMLADPAERRLYGFFKAMLASGHFAAGGEFIGADLSELALAYVQGKAGKMQEHYEELRAVLWLNLALFLKNEARIRDIAALRRQIAQLHVPEPGARGAVLEAAGQADLSASQWREGTSELQRLLGTGIPTAVSFLGVLEELSGRTPSPLLAEAAGEALSAPAGGPQDHAGVLEAVAGAVWQRLEAAREEAGITVARLLAERGEQQRRYGQLLQEALAGGASSLSELTAAAQALLANPCFSLVDHREHEVGVARAMPVYTRIGEAMRLEELGGALLGLLHERLSMLEQREREELQAEIHQAAERRLAWERRMAVLLDVGLVEWQKASQGLLETRRRWYQECEQEYAARARLWQARELLLRANRERWLRESADSAVRTGTEALRRQMGLSRQRLGAEEADITIPDLAVPAVDLEQLVRQVACGTELGELLRRARESGAEGANLRSLLTVSLPRLQCPVIRSGSAGELAAAAAEEVQRRVALLTALQMRRTVEETETAIAESIDQANRSVERDLGARLRAAGYSRSGGEHRRRAIIDQTMFGGTEWETQVVPTYTYFVAPKMDCGVDLRRETLEALSAQALQESILRARETLGRYVQLVFGRRPQERDEWSWQGISEEFRARFDAQAMAFASSAGYNRTHTEGEDSGRYMFHDTDGLFYFHIGYAPIMDEDSPERVDQPGYGELGRIMEAYLRNEARLGRGLALLQVPWYSQRFWDDDADNDGQADYIGAPSMRTVADITVSIAATATGNVWAAAAINMVDDAVFTIADVAGGYVEADQALFDFGRQVLIGFATAGVGEGFDALAAASGAFGESTIGKTFLQGLESTTTSAVSGTLGAVVLDANGSIRFDPQGFERALLGEATLASCIGGMTGSLLEGNVAGFSVWDAAEVRAVSGLVGGLAQAALEYAWTGQTTFNLLDFSLFGVSTAGGRTLSGGLLELSLGGDGPLVSLGKEGIDLSPTAVSAAVRGADTWWQNVRIRGYDLLGDTAYGEGYRGYREAGTALRSLYSFGDQRAAQLYEQILTGQARLHVGLADPASAGRTEVVEGLKQVYLASLGERWDRYSRLLAGVALQHEAWRDGYRVGVIRPDGSVVSLAENFAETALAVRGHAEMALRLAGDYGFGLFEASRPLLRDLVALRLTELLDSTVFDSYVEQAYESEDDAYRIERWSGRAIGTPLRNSGYYFIMFDDERSDAVKASVRGSLWPGTLLVDLIHNLFSNKDRIEMRQPLFKIVGADDYFGALKLLYGRGAEALEVSAEVTSLIDDVITVYEIARNVDVPGAKAVGSVSAGLETIDQIIQGVGAGVNAVIEKEFAEYWWRSGVPNFTQKKEDLEALTRFMFQQFAAGTPDRSVFERYISYLVAFPVLDLNYYRIYEDWELRLQSFGEQYLNVPYRVQRGMAMTDGRDQCTWTFEEWARYLEICESIFGD